MAKQNAYGLFVKDICRKRGVANMARMFKELDAEWRSLPEAIRQQYKDRAKSANSDHGPSNQSDQSRRESSGDIRISNSEPLSDASETKHNLEQKPNSQALVVAKRPREDDAFAVVPAEKKLKPGIPNFWKNHKMGTNISERIYSDHYLLKMRKNCEAIVGSREDTLATIPIYAFSVNVLCKHKCPDKTEIFVPIEIGIEARTLKDGRICEPYHVLIDAGPIPMGSVNHAIDHATNHKITIPPVPGYPAGARKDYKKIYKEMLEFTKTGERVLLILNPKDLAQVTGSLEWLHKKATEDGSKLLAVSRWSILPVTEFITVMYSFVHQKMLKNSMPIFALPYYINMNLEASVMDYNTSLMCEYHSKEDNQTKWCAKSCASKIFANLEELLEKIYTTYIVAKSQKPTPVISYPQITYYTGPQTQ